MHNLQPFQYEYNLSDNSDAADVGGSIAYLLERYDAISLSIINAIDVLTTIPSDQLAAVKASQHVPDNVKQSAVIIPHGRSDNEHVTQGTLDGHFYGAVTKHIKSIQEVEE